MIRLFVTRQLHSPKLIAVVCLFVLPVSAQMVRTCGSVDRATNAIRLAQVFYPDLKGRELSLQFAGGNGGPLGSATDARSFLIKINGPEWQPRQEQQVPKGAQIQPPRSGDIQLPMYLHFEFIDYHASDKPLLCSPTVFRNDGTREKMKKAREIINAHPEWTDMQDLEAVAKLGMKLGPDKKADILRLVPLRELSEFYGPLHIKDAKFSVAEKIREPGASFAKLIWSVEAAKEGAPGSVFIFVEPFGGEIVGISQ